MYKDNKFLAVIPARGGSKGIPNKNIVQINGKPLIQYTIDEALKSTYLDDIIVSTDSKEIASISKRLGAKVPYLRPKHLAQDTSKTVDTLIHVINEQKKLGYTYDYVVLLQPTQPLRKSFHIDQAIEKITTSNYDSLVSISKVKEHPLLIRRLKEDETLENLLPTNSTVRRQDFPNFHKVNGAIYINKVREIHANTSLNDNLLGYEMEEQYDLDIDTLLDLKVFNFLSNMRT